MVEDPRLPKLSECKVNDIIEPSKRKRKCTYEKEERELERERERELELENDICYSGDEAPISSEIENQIDLPTHGNSYISYDLHIVRN